MRHALLLLCLAAVGSQAQTLMERARTDQVVTMDAEDAAMKQAYARAQASLDSFLGDALSPSPRNSNHAVKVRVRDGALTEYFWVGQVRRSEQRFKGVVDNEPRLVKNVRMGQEISFAQAAIVDWLYTAPNGAMQGAFTTCVLLSREKPEEARALAAHLQLRCK
jgi:uncharacterized protein YegJ (DUF2314 family)